MKIDLKKRKIKCVFQNMLRLKNIVVFIKCITNSLNSTTERQVFLHLRENHLFSLQHIFTIISFFIFKDI